MGNEGGEWILRGLSWSDKECLHSPGELVDYVNHVGFLPLFAGEIPGFSAEEHTAAEYWWTAIEERDPWVWREILSRGGEVAYGKFFGKKSGFVSKEWFPRFVNFRRDGYDFDSLYEDGKANIRAKKIMDVFAEHTDLMSFELKRLAGFGKNGEKNFEGTVTELQMRGYLVACDFRRRRDKHGEEYGWTITAYATPEQRWGYDWVTSAYSEEPAQSQKAILAHLQELYPQATEAQLRKAIK